MAFKCVDEMIGMWFANIFHTEVIDTEGKADGLPIMCQETGVDTYLFECAQRHIHHVQCHVDGRVQ